MKHLASLVSFTVVAAALAAGCALAPDAAEPVDVDVDTSQSVDPQDTCARTSDLRPVFPLSTCPSDEDENGALCYTPCAPDYHGAGPVCWENCPPGYADDGATCRRDAHIISANTSKCPWYDACGLTLAKHCSTCPDGYANDGCTCRRDVDIFAKKSYGRGVGSPMSCAPGQEQIGALCYGACPSGGTPDGIHCLGKTVCSPDPQPAKPVYPFCFKVTRVSDVTPCNTVSVYAHDEPEAKSIVQNQNQGDMVTSISCGSVATACPAPFSKKLPWNHAPIR